MVPQLLIYTRPSFRLCIYDFIFMPTLSLYLSGSTITNCFSPLYRQLTLSTESVWTTDLVPPLLNHIICMMLKLVMLRSFHFHLTFLASCYKWIKLIFYDLLTESLTFSTSFPSTMNGHCIQQGSIMSFLSKNTGELITVCYLKNQHPKKNIVYHSSKQIKIGNDF